MIVKPSDMTPAVLLTSGKGTGPMRHRRPIYVDLGGTHPDQMADHH